jgi:hypothetical protein
MRAQRTTRFILVVSGAHVAAGHRQIDGRARSRVAWVASQPDADLIVDPDTTNIKLVARWREICEGQ